MAAWVAISARNLWPTLRRPAHRHFSVVTDRYKALSRPGGAITYDADQFKVVQRLQTLAAELQSYSAPTLDASAAMQAAPAPRGSGGGLGSLFSSWMGSEEDQSGAGPATSASSASPFVAPGPKGIYLYGSPGRVSLKRPPPSSHGLTSARADRGCMQAAVRLS